MAEFHVSMADDENTANGAEPAPSDLQLSEGKSLSFLATNLAGPIELGGLPPANGVPGGSGSDSPAPEGPSDAPSAPQPAPSDTE